MTEPILAERKIAMRSFYDRAAHSYVRRDEGLRQLFHNRLELGWLDEIPLVGKRLLDIGSGVGRLPRYVGNQAGLIIEIDLSGEMLRVARRRMTGFSHAWFVQCDAEFLPFPSASFDFVACLGLFEYIADLEPFLREYFRVTAPCGHLLFTCHNLSGLLPFRNHNYSTVDHVSEAVVGAVSKCGYRLVRRATTYHLNGRWIWWTSRILRPVSLDATLIRCVIVLNEMLQTSALFRNRGKIHLVLAERP